MMRISRIYRMLQLITMLQGRHSYTAAELAQELEVSRRTVFRDLNMLEMARIPYYFDREKGGYRISRHFFLPPINLTLTEALAMLILTGQMGGASRLPLFSHGAKAALKLESALPQSIRKHVGTIIDRLDVKMGPLSSHEGLDVLFDDLASAVGNKRICRLVYISFFEKKQITVDVHPLRLAFVGRAWYLVAYSLSHREVRTFKLGRIRKLTVTDRKFQPDVDVEIDEYFGRAWQMIPEGKIYNVHLHFEAKVAGNVAEVRWHDSQRVQWNDDGSMEYRVKVDGIGEILWWILGYGDQVEVISPAPLRKRVGAVAAEMAGKYQKRKSKKT
ncbi:MAG: YafY family transcriptional regulator [Planctomycetes bacterium]|nr:YafY family transcriptional regulator [Planctomycetota bacterium]